MGGGGKITRGICQASPLPLFLCPPVAASTVEKLPLVQTQLWENERARGRQINTDKGRQTNELERKINMWSCQKIWKKRIRTFSTVFLFSYCVLQGSYRAQSQNNVLQYKGLINNVLRHPLWRAVCLRRFIIRHIADWLPHISAARPGQDHLLVMCKQAQRV